MIGTPGEDRLGAPWRGRHWPGSPTAGFRSAGEGDRELVARGRTDRDGATLADRAARHMNSPIVGR